MISILIMGLPGSGKTTLANLLNKSLQEYGTTEWFNADVIRHKYNDWDFSDNGRLHQSIRMKKLVSKSNAKFVICDFIAPTSEIREIFNADYTIWMNTIKEGKFSDTNKLFEHPTTYEYKITSHHITHVNKILSDLGYM